MNVIYDSVNINASPFFIKGITHEQTADKELFSFGLARERGSVMIDSNYKSKVITISGTIKAPNTGLAAELEANIDTLKELLSRDGKVLDIDYAGGTRRYVAWATAHTFDRQFFNQSYVPFTITFTIPSGVGMDTTVTTVTNNGLTAAVNTGAIVAGGSAYPFPKQTLTFTAASAVTAVTFKVNGDSVTYTGAIAASDVLIFDCANKKVTKNGAEVDYTGIFPRFIVGTNNWEIDVTRTSCTFNLVTTYTKQWL